MNAKFPGLASPLSARVSAGRARPAARAKAGFRFGCGPSDGPSSVTAIAG